MASPLLAQPADARQILSVLTRKSHIVCHKGALLFRQGDPASEIFYIEAGEVKLTRTSSTGREVIVAILGRGDFAGEGVLLGRDLRATNARCLTRTSAWRIDREYLLQLIRTQREFACALIGYLLTRNERYQDDLADALFNSTEKRLARALLLLAHFGGSGEPLASVPAVSQATLAQLLGTSRERVSTLMNRFRRMGFIEYSRTHLTVRSTLLKVLLHE